MVKVGTVSPNYCKLYTFKINGATGSYGHAVHYSIGFNFIPFYLVFFV